MDQEQDLRPGSDKSTGSFRGHKDELGSGITVAGTYEEICIFFTALNLLNLLDKCRQLTSDCAIY